MKRTILVISGNKSMSYVLRTFMEKSYDLIAVTDVISGMEQIRTVNEISLVIIDTDFQQKECLEFISYINSSFLHKKPVFVLSSLKGDALNTHRKETQAQQIISKPFNPVSILESLEKHFAIELADNESRIF